MIDLCDLLKLKFSNYNCKLNHLNLGNDAHMTLDNFPHCDLDIDLNRLKKCAILIILFRKNKEFNILFTIRSSQLRTYPGEICFPGGKFDSSLDRNLEDTAFRETHEEIGLTRKNLDLICQLCPFVSPVGHYLVPFICLLKRESGVNPYEETFQIVNSLRPNPKEVQSIFCLPFSYIFDSELFSERISVLKVQFKWPNALKNMKTLISNKLDFSDGYLNRIFINLDDWLFESNLKPASPVLYGINATVILFVILNIQNESEFILKLEENFFLTSKTIDEYIKLIRFASYILYRNFLLENNKIKSKI